MKTRPERQYKKRPNGAVRWMMSWLALIVIGLGSLPAHAQDLLSCYTQALKFDPQLAGAQYEHQASREILKQAYARLLPDLTLEAAHLETRDDIKSSDNTVFATGNTSYPTDTYIVAIVQPIFNYASILGVSKAKEELKQSDVQLISARQAVITRVAQVYFSALAAKDNYDFARAEEAAVERNFELAKERNAMGLTPIQDKLDSEARYAYVSAGTIEARNALDDALEALFEVSGVKTESLANVKADLVLTGPDPADLDTWMQIALEHNTALREQKHAQEVARKEIERLKAGHYPVLDLQGTDNWRDTDGSLFGGGSEVDTQEISVRLSLPIYKGGAVNSQTRQARQMYKAAGERVREQTLAVKRETRAAFLGVKSSLSKVDALKRAVASQQLALEYKQEGFKSGINTMINVLDAQRDLYAAKRDYAQARYDYILNILKLKGAVGTLSEEDVTLVNGWLE